MRNLIANKIQDISKFYVMELLQRAKQLEQQGRDVIHMEIGEPDFATPDAVVRAGQQYLAQGNVKYTPAAGLMALREKIAEYYDQQYGAKVSPGRIFITPGASGALLLAMASSLNEEDELLMADPGYPCNGNLARLINARSRLIAVSEKESFQLNAALIQQHWNAQTKAVLIASPSNPTGTVIAEDALEAAINATQSLNGLFFSDEIYHGLVYDIPAVSALNFSDDVLVINSFSKYFGMTGWRVGWLIVPEQFIDAVERLAQNIYIATASISQYAALASFEPENLRQLEDRKKEMAKRRDYLYENLIKLGFKLTIKPQGAFYLYANCSAFTDDSFKFAKALLEKEAVAVTPGKDFGVFRENQYIRFAYTVSIDRMEEALSRIGSFICQ